MTNNVIHIKLEKKEAIKAKKDILNSESSLIKIKKIIKMYHSLRSEELALKSRLLTKVRGAKLALGKLKRTLPKFTIPEILQKEEVEEFPEIEDKIEQVKQAQYDDDLEIQLQDIQDKLRRLQ